MVLGPALTEFQDSRVVRQERPYLKTPQSAHDHDHVNHDLIRTWIKKT